MSIVSGIVNIIADTATGLKGALSDTAAKAISDAIEQGGNLTDAITKNAPELLTNDTFMRVATKMGDNLTEIKQLEPGFHAGTGNVDDVLKALDINATDDIARGFSGLQDSISASMRATDSLADDLGSDLAGISRPVTTEPLEAAAEGSLRQAPTTPEGIRAQEAAARRAAERQAAQEAQEQTAREASETAARQAQEQAAREASESAARETGEAAAQEGAEAAAAKPKGNIGKIILGATVVGTLIPGDTAKTPEELAAEEAATDGNAVIQGREVNVAQIPLHLMTDAEFMEYASTLEGPIDQDELLLERQQALVDNGLAEIDADGNFKFNQEKWLEARQKFENGIQNNLTPEAAAALARAQAQETAEAAAPNSSGIGGLFAGLQDMFKEIVEMIQGFIKTLGGGGGLFGNLQRGGNTPQASNQQNTNTQQGQQPTIAPAPPQPPPLTPAQQAEQQLQQEHRGYAQATHQGLADGSLSYAALDTTQIAWERDEIITGNADMERIYQENIDGKFDGGTKGMLHMDEDEGLLYINKDANGDVVAYRVNDHINDIGNLNDLAWSKDSLTGFSNVLLANDRNTPNYNNQGGMIKTVEFEDRWGDGKDLKNEELQFHIRVDAQGRHNISVINDDYKQNNGPALSAAQAQSNPEVAKEDPGFDYYRAGKDPVQERLFNEQQSQQRQQRVNNAVGDGIRDAGKMIEGMIHNGATINIGNNNPTVSMGNRNIGMSPTSRYEELENEARSNNRMNGINID